MTEEKKPRILLVEDTLTQAMLFQHTLEKHGFQVKIARSGRQALEVIQKDRPDAVLTDINMPEMSGYELAQKIKADSTTSDITVILLTATLSPEAIYECIKSGADEIALKGLKEPAFAEFLHNSLQRRVESDCSSVKATVNLSDSRTAVEFQPQKVLRLLLSVYEIASKSSE